MMIGSARVSPDERGRRWRSAVAVAFAVVAVASCTVTLDEGVKPAGSQTIPAGSQTIPAVPPTISEVVPDPTVIPAPSTIPPPVDPPAETEMPHVDPLVGLGLVDRLVVAEPGPEVPEYRRARFGDGWNYDPSTGCNTRELVLIEESLIPPKVDDRCRSSDGWWISFYDGEETDDPADLQIDHFIPLSNAWRSGAWAWSDERRRAFANDLENPHALVAVSGRTNQSKGDRSPDQWMPPDRSVWCAYTSNWVEVKDQWDLTVTPNEKSTLVQILQGC